MFAWFQFSSWLADDSLLMVPMHVWERKSSGVSSSSYKGTNPIRLQPTIMISCNLYHPLKAHSPNIVTWGIRDSIYEFVGGTILSIAFHFWSPKFISFSHGEYIHSPPTVSPLPESLNSWHHQLWSPESLLNIIQARYGWDEGTNHPKAHSSSVMKPDKWSALEVWWCKNYCKLFGSSGAFTLPDEIQCHLSSQKNCF